MSAPTTDATPLQDEALPPSEWHGRWPGVVVSTADPLKLGRVKVRVPQVYGDPTGETDFIPDADLPWALPSFAVHDYHADFEPGDGVWVTFWGGNPNFPIWCGQYVGDGDAPSEFTSSYTPTPKARVLRTTNGHIIEMRWVEGQEQIRVQSALGSFVKIIDAPALGGPKIILQTVGGQKIEAMDLPLPAINVQSLGTVLVQGAAAVTVQGQGVTIASTGTAPTVQTGGGTLASTFVGNALYTFLGTLTYTVALALTLSTAGLLTLSGGTGLAILVTAGLVSLGAAGLKYKLVDSRFLTLVYNGHTHSGVTPGGGSTGPPDTPFTIGPIPPAVPLASVATTNTEAN
jgi:hypothetical protein